MRAREFKILAATMGDCPHVRQHRQRLSCSSSIYSRGRRPDEIITAQVHQESDYQLRGGTVGRNVFRAGPSRNDFARRPKVFVAASCIFLLMATIIAAR